MKTFNDDERQTIKQRLVAAGKRFFGEKGVKGTGIQDLAVVAGIATGSFYAFYESKERLFFDILMAEYAANGEAFVRLAAMDGAPASTLKAMMKGALAAFRADPLMRRMIDRDDRALLRRKLPASDWKSLEAASNGLMERFVEDWQSQGLIVPGNPRTIALLFTCHFFIDRHAEEIGSDEVEDVIDLFIRLVAEGLTGRRL
jgi:AcrR family transcriptional regulator